MTLNGISASPSCFCSVYRKLAGNQRYTFVLAVLKSNMKSDIAFLLKRGIPQQYRYPPLGFVVPSRCPHSISDFFVQCTVNRQNIPVYRCLAFLNQVKFGVLAIDTLLVNLGNLESEKPVLIFIGLNTHHQKSMILGYIFLVWTKKIAVLILW